MPVGELFILGFFGKTIPAWLREFAGRYGLGGVILFDYSCQTRQYDNNIESRRRCSGSARRFPRCRQARWSSSIRKAGWCGG